MLEDTIKNPSAREQLRKARIVVIKIGSAVLAPGGALSAETVNRLAKDINEAMQSLRGRRIIIVTSGAVASGFRALGLTRAPKAIVQKQAAAAVGQQRLMGAWALGFASVGLTVAQVLLTGEDIADRTRSQNARRTLEELLFRGVIPIINENDSVSYSEIKLGDNDRLSALVASLVQADALLALSTVEGVYASGTGRVIEEFESVAKARPHVTTDVSEVGTGGMVTKLAAAQIAGDAGVVFLIAGGGQMSIVSRALAGELVGTVFCSPISGRSSRQRWLGYSAKARGRIEVDAGAAAAIEARGSSLLPRGIVRIEGVFDKGAAVDIACATVIIARGIAAYNSDELGRIAGHTSAEIHKILGYVYSAEAVHRNDLVLMRG